MKKVEKITKVVTIIMLVMMLLTICTNVFAANTDLTKYDPDAWKKANGTKVNTEGVEGWVASIIKVVSIVGSGAAIIILIILGVKYMMGSAEEKAEYKKTLLPYVIGAVFVFGASALTGVIYNFMANA